MLLQFLIFMPQSCGKHAHCLITVVIYPLITVLFCLDTIKSLRSCYVSLGENFHVIVATKSNDEKWYVRMESSQKCRTAKTNCSCSAGLLTDQFISMYGWRSRMINLLKSTKSTDTKIQNKNKKNQGVNKICSLQQWLTFVNLRVSL